MLTLPIGDEFTANIVFVAITSSLIPAVVIKLLLAFFFQKNAGFIKLFLALMASTFILYGIGYAADRQNLPMVHALVQTSPLVLVAAIIVAQTVILAVVVTDDIGQRIPLWHWFVVLILQYVLSLGLAYLLALAVSL